MTTTIDVTTISPRDLRILTHYAAGTELKGIATIVGIDREAVLGVVEQYARFERSRAGDLVQAYHKQQKRKAAKTTEPATVAATQPAPELKPATDAPTDVDEPEQPAEQIAEVETLPPATDEADAATTGVDDAPAAPEPTPVPDVYIEARTDMPRSPVETVLARAAAAGGRYAEQAAHIRRQIVALDAALAKREQIAEMERRVAQLRAELDAATAELESARADVTPTVAPASPSPVRPADKVIRSWARSNGIECNPVGSVRQDVVDRYLAAHAAGREVA